MDVISFFIDHFPSDSRMMAEFIMENNKVRLLHFSMMRGNVIPLNKFRTCQARAEQLFNHVHSK